MDRTRRSDRELKRLEMAEERDLEDFYVDTNVSHTWDSKKSKPFAHF